MNKWHADEICNGIEHEYGVDVYLASEVDAFFKEAGIVDLAKRVVALERAAKAVCDYDWSDNDDDAVRAVEKLRSLL